ncbi:MAG: hypothetical protein P4M08_14080 [Oligoflexia bacterium]|nr:hypothetical protein [Oligoflexia bacterium]
MKRNLAKSLYTLLIPLSIFVNVAHADFNQIGAAPLSLTCAGDASPVVCTMAFAADSGDSPSSEPKFDVRESLKEQVSNGVYTQNDADQILNELTQREQAGAFDLRPLSESGLSDDERLALLGKVNHISEKAAGYIATLVGANLE